MSLELRSILIDESQLHMLRTLIQAEVKYAIEVEKESEVVDDQRQICDIIFNSLMETING